MSGLLTHLPVADLLIPLLVKSSLLLLLAALLARAVDRAAAATRHRVWATAFAALALLPVLAGALPGLELAWLPAVEADGAPAFVSREAGERLSTGLRGAELSAADLQGAELTAELNAELNAELKGADLQAADLTAAELQAADLETADRGAAAPPVPPSLPPLLAKLFIVAYPVGVCLLLGWLFLGIVLVRRWAAGGEVVTDAASWSPVLEPLAGGISRRIELVVTPRVRVPMVWMPLFARRATVLLPEVARSWTPAERRDTLVHELAHVERKDGQVQLAARLVAIAYWFHPLVWVALARLRLEAERACDDRVLATGSASCDYAERLVALARGTARLRPRGAVAQATVALSGRQQLARRVHALLDAGRRRVPAGPLATALLATAVLLPALVLAPVRLVEAAGPPPDGPFAAVDGALEGESAGSPEEGRDSGRRDRRPDAGAGPDHHLDADRDADADHDADAADHDADMVHDADMGHHADPDQDPETDQDADTVQDVDAGPDLASGTKGGWTGDGTPLIVAVGEGDVGEMVRLMVDGADPAPVPLKPAPVRDGC